ncbi:MAG: hypothetical protein ABSG29_01555 [Steroidobacteraceae bacterium]
MKPIRNRSASPLVWLLALASLQTPVAQAARDKIDVHAYLNDSCIVADEPYYVPPGQKDAAGEEMTPKFFPLLGVVIGKLVELFINHEVQGKAKQMKAGADRKDTRYATTNEMNLYRADLTAAPVVRINGRLGCMTVVAAHLKPDGTDCTAAYVPKQLDLSTMHLPQEQWKSTRTDDSVENQLRRANICVDGNAWAVYEARFEFSKDGTVYRLKDAGYRINSLLTTEDKNASRTVLYTLKISQPSASDQLEVLSSAWIKLGTVSAGAKSTGSPDSASPWLKVPPLSTEARRAYDEKTGPNQQLMGEIEALKRAMARNQRLIEELDRRSAEASADLVEGLKQERTKTAVQVQVQGAELDVRNAEFRDLPHDPLEFMPVEIEVAVTETESEKKSQLALAQIVGDTGGAVASAVGSQVSDMISRSIKLADADAAPASAADTSELARARARYFDALVDVKTASNAKSQDNLAAAKTRYNDARRSLGLDPLP